MKTLKQSLLVILFLSLILCGVYPLAVTGIGYLFFKEKTTGSLIKKDGKIIGSVLIGQNFTDPKYFYPRPSNAGAAYDGANSSGSNLGPTSKKLEEKIKNDLVKLEQKNLKTPTELVTASASGLDPHISPKAALFQAKRVAEARNIPIDTVNKLINEKTQIPFLNLFGKPTVNVLELNLALDALK